MEHDSMKRAMVNEHSPEEELLEEAGEQVRWTPVAFTLAVGECEVTAAAACGESPLPAPESDEQGILEAAEPDEDDMDEQDRWTPMALQLAMSKE
jgi:hypothetical protein